MSKRLLAVALLCAASVAWPQAPVVPIDHYGPPVCRPGAPPPAADRMTAEKAIAIEETGAADSAVLPSVSPLENFDITRRRLADYGDCVGQGGCYWADLDAQYRRAEATLDLMVSSRKTGEKLAIVMDIDETSLSSYCEMQREDFGYIRTMSDAWVVTPEAAVAIPGALRLYNKARAAGVFIFFITGRPDNQLDATKRNLESAGFHGWSGLALRNTVERGMATIAYKSARRRQIASQGYRLIMSIGDQWSDLNGEPRAEVSVKLPNPFYFLP